MKPRTEEFLYFLLWNAEKLTNPTFRNLTDSFESWAYRSGLFRQIQQLEARKLLEREPNAGTAAVYRLSERGRLVALGGFDPPAEWNRTWDRQWRLVVFDFPETEASARARLRFFLRNNRFGCLQKSVWISPDPLNQVTKQLSAAAKDVKLILTLEARPAASEDDRSIVKSAWNFNFVNGLYDECLRIFRKIPKVKPNDANSLLQLQQWGELERSAWRRAISADPLLPEPLLPEGYLGKQAWNERVLVLAEAARLINRCEPTAESLANHRQGESS